MDITNPPPTNESPTILQFHEVSKRLKTCKKPKGLLYGDITPQLVNKYADILAIPLTRIYNYSLALEQWPKQWKTETVTAIPKNSSPSDFGQLRNISCTNLFSKVLEYFVLQRLRNEVSTQANQFGGLPGTGVNHYLTETWDKILTTLEHDERSATTLVSIDFAKAFNTMSHQACIKSFIDKGATKHSIAMISAFLRDRCMRFKVGREFSTERQILGGSPQGTLLGNLLFIIATDDLENVKGMEYIEPGEVESGEETSGDESFNTALGSPVETDNVSDISELDSFVHMRRNEGMPAELLSSDSEEDDTRMTTYIGADEEVPEGVEKRKDNGT